MSGAPNWIMIKENQNATYIVDGDFPYHVQMGAGSKVTMKSKHPG